MRRQPPQPHLDDPGDPGVARWRRTRLERAGFNAGTADTLARDARYDLHAVLELIDRGCPPALAARILAPIDEIDERLEAPGGRRSA